MNIFECIKMAFSALWSNKVRSLLTMLGIIIGVAAVIALLSLGQAAQGAITSQMTQLGTNQINVMLMGSAQFDHEDVGMLLERVPGLVYASPVLTERATVKADSKTHDTTIEGVSADYDLIRAYSMQTGRWFSDDEVFSRHKVAVVGTTAYEKLFGGPPETGRTLSIKGQTFVIIGITAEKGGSFGMDPDDCIWIPFRTAERFFSMRRITNIVFKAESAETASRSAAHLTRILEEHFRASSRIASSSVRSDPFRVISQDELLDAVSQMTGTFTVLLAGIAGVSLLVGGIGIMNIMLVSVTERTREIGIRKAIGAKRRDIRLQFIIESVVVSATGGAVGIVFGGWLGKFLGAFGQLDVGISLSSVLLSFGFASIVGMFFGVYPATKASKLDPIQALRYE